MTWIDILLVAGFSTVILAAIIYAFIATKNDN